MNKEFLKNNLKGLGVYVAYILLSFFIYYYGVLYVNTFVADEGFFSIFMRFVVFVVVLALPIGLGALLLDYKQPEKTDYLNGLFVIGLELILWIVAFIMTLDNPFGMLPTGAAGDNWRFFKFYAFPGQVLKFCVSMKESLNILYLLLTCFLPTITFGIGIKLNRKSQEKKALKEKNRKKHTKKTSKK